jgi:hypothetical protein
VVIYTLLDELLFPLFRPLIGWLSALAGCSSASGDWLGRLPPYAALVALGVPFVVIEPMKVVAIWWAGTGHVITGTIGLLLAHALSLLVVERIFHAVYQPLMRIEWFARLLRWLFSAARPGDRLGQIHGGVAGGGGLGAWGAGVVAGGVAGVGSRSSLTLQARIEERCDTPHPAFGHLLPQGEKAIAH